MGRRPSIRKKKLATTQEPSLVESNEVDNAFPVTRKSLNFVSTPLPPLSPLPPLVWYLGIDFGTTGISAALFDRSTEQVFPIAWSSTAQTDSTATFRLPAVVDRETCLRNLKPYLKVALPYYDEETNQWQPVFKLSSQQQVTLSEMLQAIQTFLSTFKPIQPAELDIKTEIENSVADSDEAQINLNISSEINAGKLESLFSLKGGYTIEAVGMTPEKLNGALSDLAGVIISCPSHWPEAYRFNLRESVLTSELVKNAEQICFVEESIATFLAEVHSHYLEEKEKLPIGNTEVLTKRTFPWQGVTTIFHAGTTIGELALVDVPENIENLNYSDFTIRSFPYAGAYLNQDIICQLLLNKEFLSFLQSREQLPSFNLEFPLPGEPDLPVRYSLQQWLDSSPLGENLLASAEYVKLNLPHQDSLTVNIGEFRWVLRREDLENRVITPFVQRLNREFNTLLARLGIPVEGIAQAICTGGTALLPSLSNWLRQKLPNAKIIYQSDAQVGKVAMGLAVLPMYPELFDRTRQQYSDYFLLMEVLRVCGNEPLSVEKIRNLLERKGINTRACFANLLAVLESYLPDGIVPSELDAGLLSEESWQNLNYQALTAIKPFDREDGQTYCLNAISADRLYRYLCQVLVRTQQKLEEPYALHWLGSAANSNASYFLHQER